MFQMYIPSRCLTMPRRLLPWAAISTRLPSLIWGTISSFQKGRALAIGSLDSHESAADPATLTDAAVEGVVRLHRGHGDIIGTPADLPLGHIELGSSLCVIEASQAPMCAKSSQSAACLVIGILQHPLGPGGSFLHGGEAGVRLIASVSQGLPAVCTSPPHGSRWCHTSR